MKSEWDFGTVIGLVSGVICILVAMVWPEGDTAVAFDGIVKNVLETLREGSGSSVRIT